MRDVKIKINDDGYASSYEKFIGIQNENEATRLVFDLPDIYKKDGSYQYVAFTLPDGTIKVRRLVDYACIIDSEITRQRGEILISVIIKSVETVLDIETGFIMSSQPISGYIKKTIVEETGTNSIDKNVRIYLDEFDALLSEIRATDKRLASILDSDPSKYAEIIDARGGYTVLKNRLDAMLSSINTNYNNIKSNSREIEVNHNDIVSNYSTLLTKINALASGSPKGTYETATLLKADNPDTGVYIATGNGHIYSWTKDSTGDPIDLGVYQATTIADKSIKYPMLEEGLQENIELSNLETTATYTSIDTAYYGFDNSIIQVQANKTGFACGYMDVSPNDLIYVPWIPQGNYGANYAIYFCDNTDKILSHYLYTDLWDSTNRRPYQKMFRVPDNCVKMYINTYYGESEKYWYPYKVKGYNYMDSRVTSALTNKEELTYDEVKQDKIYSLLNWNYTLSYFNTYIFNVSPLDKLNIITKLKENNQFLAAIYTDNDLKPIGYSLPQGNNSSSIDVNEDVIVPAGASKILLCVSASTIPKVYKYGLSSSGSTVQTKNIHVTYDNGVLTMENTNNGNNIIMQNYGGNNLFMIRSYTVGGIARTIATDMTPAPYNIEAVNNANGDRTGNNLLYGFVGGNHQWNNKGSGSTATARQVSLSIYADNANVINGYNGYCNNVKIIETNRVQANNTCLEAGNGREVLEEKIVFNFDGKKLHLVNTITPLEEIIIKVYFGIQLNDCADNLYKVYADKLYDVSTMSSLNEKPDTIYGLNVSSKMLSYGLGKYQYNNRNDYKVTISNSKAYYVPVYSNRVHFNTSDINYIEGEYIFDVNQI